tara:strand:- start:28 stop:783 length:756 start_codon:yes stop_codon:yes gene_type:complete
MDFNFEKKNILVTGSTKGLGLFIGKTLKNLGANVIFNSRSKNEYYHENIFQNKFNYEVADFSNLIDTKVCFEKIKLKYGTLDHIVCNVGDGRKTTHKSGSYEELNLMLQNNLFPSTNVIFEAPNFMKHNGGSIVNISSICGLEDIGAPIGYQVAKAGLNMYVKSFAKKLSQFGIRINNIAPGNLIFEGSVWEKKLKMNKEDTLLMLQKDVILNRFGTLEEITNFVVFLLSSLSSFSTGNTYIADGGQTRGI